MKFKIGQRIAVGDIMCAVRFISQGAAYVSPMTDDPEDIKTARHIAYARVDAKGKVTLL